jgi:hypothetical protein
MRGEPHRWEITFRVSLGDVRWGAAGVGHEKLVHGWKMPAQLYQSFSTAQHKTKREFTTGCEDDSLTVSRGKGAILLAGCDADLFRRCGGTGVPGGIAWRLPLPPLSRRAWSR